MRVRLFVLLLASLPAIAQTQTALPPDIDPVTLSRLPRVTPQRSGRGRAEAAWRRGRRPSRGRDPTHVTSYSPRERSLGIPSGVNSPVGPRYFQLAVLIIAREIDQQYQWSAHEPAGLRQGLEQSVIDVVKYNRDVAGLSDKDATLITFGRTLYREHKREQRAVAEDDRTLRAAAHGAADDDHGRLLQGGLHDERRRSAPPGGAEGAAAAVESMTRFVAACCAALVTGAAFLALGAQAPPSETTRRLDPAFDAIVSPGTTLETLKDGFGFINGIVWMRESGGGHLLVSDIPANVVHRWTPDGTLSSFLEKPDWTRTTGRPAAPRFGANGIAVDPQGRVVYAAEADRAVVRVEKDGKRTVLAERYEGKRLNSPNDLVFRSDGALYFTDPSGGNRFADWDLKKELPFQGVFLLKDGKLQPVVQDLERPNGIALSPDEKFLYVNDSVKRAILRYEVQRDGSAANGRGVRGHERRKGHRQSRRDEVRRQRESVLGGSRRHLGVLARGQAPGHDRAARVRARVRLRRCRREITLHGGEQQARPHPSPQCWCPMVKMFLAGAGVAVLAVVLAAQSRAPEVSGDWPMYSHSLSGQRYSPLAEITPANVATLAPAWSLRLTQPAAGRRARRRRPPAQPSRAHPHGDAGSAAPARPRAGRRLRDRMPSSRASNPQVTPIVIGGVMYLPARGNQVLALDADTGKEVWRHELPRYVTTTARGVAYWPGDGQHGAAHPADRGPAAASRSTPPPASRRPASAPTASSRSPCRGTACRRSTGTSPSSAPPPAKSRSAEPATRAPSTCAPARSCGTSTPCRCPGEVGHNTWLDNGWRDRSGVNVWAWYMTLDAERGILYMPVAGPAGNYWGGDRPGNNLFANSIVAVDAETGQVPLALPDRASRPVGLRTCRLRRCSWTSCRTAGACRRSRRSARPATCSSSTASPASRSSASRNGRCRRATCPASGIRRRSRFR